MSFPRWRNPNVGGGSVTDITNTPNDGVTITIADPTTTPDLTVDLATITPTGIDMTGLFSGGTPQTIASGDIESVPTVITRSHLLITGSTNFSRINSAGLPDRTILWIRFPTAAGNLTVNSSIAATGSLLGIRLAGNSSWASIPTNSCLFLMLDLTGGFWFQVSRMTF